MQTDVMKSSGDTNGCDFGKADVTLGNAHDGGVSTFGKRLSIGRLTFDAYGRHFRLLVRWTRRPAAVS